MIVKHLLRFLDAVDTLYKVQLRHRQNTRTNYNRVTIHNIVYFMMCA